MAIPSNLNVNGQPVELVSHVCYSKAIISFGKYGDLNAKFQNFETKCKMISRTLTGKTSKKDTRITLYKVMYTPSTRYGSENRAFIYRDIGMIQVADMRSLSNVRKCSKVERIGNENIGAEMDIYSTKK